MIEFLRELTKWMGKIEEKAKRAFNADLILSFSFISFFSLSLSIHDQSDCNNYEFLKKDCFLSLAARFLTIASVELCQTYNTTRIIVQLSTCSKCTCSAFFFLHLSFTALGSFSVSTSLLSTSNSTASA